MAIKATVVTIATTPTALNGAQSDWNAGASYIVAVPTAGQTVYVGGSDVTTATGYPFVAGTEHEAGLDSDDGHFASGTAEIMYGVVASGTQAVNVLAQGI